MIFVISQINVILSTNFDKFFDCIYIRGICDILMVNDDNIMNRDIGILVYYIIFSIVSSPINK